MSEVHDLDAIASATRVGMIGTAWSTLVGLHQHGLTEKEPDAEAVAELCAAAGLDASVREVAAIMAQWWGNDVVFSIAEPLYLSPVGNAYRPDPRIELVVE